MVDLLKCQLGQTEGRSFLKEWADGLDLSCKSDFSLHVNRKKREKSPMNTDLEKNLQQLIF